jgi:regulator of protease activity HflC (stomatin/prohibitin superfamily)
MIGHPARHRADATPGRRRFHQALGAGVHVLVPFVDALRYKHSLEEVAIDVAAQVCITPGHGRRRG